MTGSPAVAAFHRKPRSRKKTVRLTARYWAEAEALWATGECTLEVIAKKYGIKITTASRHFKAKGIVKSSTAAPIVAAATAAVTKAIIDDSALTAARIKETKDQHYQMSTNLAKLVWKEILDSRAAGVPVHTVGPNVKTLQVAINALKQAREERFAVLGLDRPDALDTNEIPILEVTELTEEEMQVLREAEDPTYATTDGAAPAPTGADDIMAEGDA